MPRTAGALVLAVALTGCSDGIVNYGAPSPPVTPAATTWREHHFGEIYGNHPPSFDDVATSGDVIVVTGTGATTASSSTGYIWTSLDRGRTWKPGQAGRPYEGPAALAAVEGVVAHPGGFLAVGSLNSDSRGPHPPAVLTSRDGLRWQVAPMAGVAARDTPRDVVWDGAGFVAVGAHASSRGARPAAWRSADGREWRLLRAPASSLGMFETVAAARGRVLATGSNDREVITGQVLAGEWTPVSSPGVTGNVTGTVAARTADFVVAATSCRDDGACTLSLARTAAGAALDPVDPPSPGLDIGAVLLAAAGDTLHLYAAGRVFTTADLKTWTESGPHRLDMVHSLFVSGGRPCLAGMARPHDSDEGGDLSGPAIACVE